MKVRGKGVHEGGWRMPEGGRGRRKQRAGINGRGRKQLVTRRGNFLLILTTEKEMEEDRVWKDQGKARQGKA